MRLKHLCVALAASVLAATFVAADVRASDVHVVTKQYVGGGTRLAYVGLCEGGYSTTNLGVVCFEPAAHDFVTVKITDATGLPVAGVPVFVSGGNWDIRPFFCGESAPMRVEQGRELVVWLGGPQEAAWACLSPLGRPFGVATVGEVQATFTR